MIGIHADCPLIDIRKIRVNMIETVGEGIVVRIPIKRTGTARVCPISGEFAVIIRKYLRLRLRAQSEIPIKTEFFFIHYRNGKCCRGNLGRRTICRMAEEIAQFLKLKNAQRYTTESFRMISPKSVDGGFYTEGSRSTNPTCSVTASPVATLSNVEVKNANNSTVNMR